MASKLQKGSGDLRYPPRHVVILATPNAQSLEIAGPVEVFAMAEQKLREAGRTKVSGYNIEVVSAVSELKLRSSSGLTISADRSFDQVTEPIDTLLVAAGMELGLPKIRRPSCDGSQRKPVQYAASAQCVLARSFWPKPGFWTTNV